MYLQKLLFFSFLFFYFILLLTACSSVPKKHQTFEYNQSLQKQEEDMRTTLSPIKKLFSKGDIVIEGFYSTEEFDIWSFETRNSYSFSNKGIINSFSGMRSFCEKVSEIACNDGLVKWNRPKTGDDSRLISIKRLNNLTFIKAKSSSEFIKYKQNYMYPKDFESGLLYNTYFSWVAIKPYMEKLSRLASKLNEQRETQKNILIDLYPALQGDIPNKIQFSNKKFYNFEDFYNYVETTSTSFIKNKMTSEYLEGKLSKRLKHQKNQIEYQKRLKAKEKQAEVKHSQYKSYMDVHKQVWSDRFNKSYELGDRVCTYKNNLQGNVELVSNDKVKVFWSRRYIGSDGLFFGTFLYSNFTGDYQFKYNYEDLNTYEWINKDQVSNCTIAKN